MNATLDRESLFQTFFIGGFECSTHRLESGRRLDMIDATRHERFAYEDYIRAREHGIGTVRDGLRWHLIEKRPYQYDFSSVLPMVRAAQAAHVQVIWDLCHYGWPDDLDIFDQAFPNRFARMARAFVSLLAGEGEQVPFLTPINEISFFAWASGEVAYFYPCAVGRGHELKIQLIRAAIEAIESIWEVAPGARIVNVDPMINVIAHPDRIEEQRAAESYHEVQFEARDMLAGRVAPWLGGREKYLDIVGVNYYPFNQWYYGDTIFHPNEPLSPLNPQYRPVSEILGEVYRRYERPMLIAETGTEAEWRADWLQYVAREARVAIDNGVRLEGLCWYPIVNFPGWDDNRYCQNGLWDYADDDGRRPIFKPLSRELTQQQKIFAADVLDRDRLLPV